MWCIALVNLILTTGVLAINGKCRVLALGGNSDKGAYEAGAISGLINNLPLGEFSYDVITGNGVGAFNAFILGQYAIGQEIEAGTFVTNFWYNFEKSKFYKEWVGGETQGIFFEHGLYDSEPMKEAIKSVTTSSYKRWVGVGATDLLSGNYVFFNSSKLDLDIMNIGVLSSMATDTFFPYVEFKGLELVTGSIKYSVDVLSGINACEELGYTQDDIIIDVIMCSGSQLPTINAAKYTTVQVLKRTNDIEDYRGTMKVVTNAIHDYPDINIRNVIYPSQAIPESDVPYNFDKSDLQDMINLGIQDAINSIKGSVAYQ